METIYYTTLVVNGFDDQGYYQRANLLNNLCSTYQVSTQDGCSARFEGAASASAAAARAAAPTPANAPAPGKDQTASTGATSSAPVLEGLLGTGVGKKGREAAEGVRRRAASARRQGQARRGRAGLPAGRRTVKRGSGASNLTASPVLVGAVTLLVDAGRGLPVLQRQLGPPVRAHLRPQGRRAQLGQPGARQRRAHRRRARGHRQQDLAGAQRQRQAHRAPGPEAGPRHRAAARGHHLHRAPALGARA